MVIHEHEGSVFVAVFQPVECEVGYDVCGISLVVNFFAHVVHHGVVIRALSGEYVPVVKSGGVIVPAVSEMPFAHHCGLVSRCLQEFGKCDLSPVQVCAQCGYAVDVIVRSGQDYRPARRANRVGAKAVVKAHATFCDAVQVGRFVNPTVITTHGM